MFTLRASLPLALQTEHTQAITTTLANLERVRASYAAQLNSDKPTRLSAETLRADIDRVDARIAIYRKRLNAA